MKLIELLKIGAFGVVLVLTQASPNAFAQDMSPASKGYMDSMAKMQKDMPKTTGDGDVDFAQMMIPHHQGASDMAKVLLDTSKDPTLRKMAAKMIKDQGREISQLQDWLKKHKK
ncbi:MAG: DUF305 domain-containing protein [Pseudolabrys sp.]